MKQKKVKEKKMIFEEAESFKEILCYDKNTGKLTIDMLELLKIIPPLPIKPKKKGR